MPECCVPGCHIEAPTYIADNQRVNIVLALCGPHKADVDASDVWDMQLFEVEGGAADAE